MYNLKWPVSFVKCVSRRRPFGVKKLGKVLCIDVIAQIIRLWISIYIPYAPVQTLTRSRLLETHAAYYSTALNLRQILARDYTDGLCSLWSACKYGFKFRNTCNITRQLHSESFTIDELQSELSHSVRMSECKHYPYISKEMSAFVISSSTKHGEHRHLAGVNNQLSQRVDFKIPPKTEHVQTVWSPIL